MSELPKALAQRISPVLQCDGVRLLSSDVRVPLCEDLSPGMASLSMATALIAGLASLLFLHGLLASKRLDYHMRRSRVAASGAATERKELEAIEARRVEDEKYAEEHGIHARAADK